MVRTPATNRSGGEDFEFNIGKVLYYGFNLFLSPVFGQIGLKMVSTVRTCPTYTPIDTDVD